MRRLITLLLAAGLVVSAATGAYATDVKVSGKVDFSFRSLEGIGFDEDSSANKKNENFEVLQRFRTQLEFIASENLKGVFQIEIGDQIWGQAERGAALGADGKVVEVRYSYIDWTVPDTALKTRMGVQCIKLPQAAFRSSPILSADVAGLTLSYSVNDSLALTGFWARPYDGYEDKNGNFSNEGNEEMDVFGLVAPISYDGHQITPYAVYANLGKDADFSVLAPDYAKALSKGGDQFSEDVEAYWLGIAYTMTAFDPFVLKMDFMYGAAETDDYEQKGWIADIKASYALDSMTPAIFAYYGSGDEGDNPNDCGIMPAIDGTWGATSFGYKSNFDSAYRGDKHLGDDPYGSWGVGIEFDDISFVEDLTHCLRFAYMQGTNDKARESGSLLRGKRNEYYMSTEDSVFEIDFMTRYELYDNFIMTLDLGYMKMDAKDANGDTKWDNPYYKTNLTFSYRF